MQLHALLSRWVADLGVRGVGEREKDWLMGLGVTASRQENILTDSVLA